MRQILFVCTGNICRSPMAEGQLRSLLAQSGNTSIEVQSAGIGALAGQPPSQHAVEAMSEWGADITHQRSQMIHTDL
ncbi:MAG: glycine hydroxymethyltransferase, partial [Limisphaerales bacterium]